MADPSSHEEEEEMFEKRAYPHNTLILNISSHFAHFCKTKIHPRMNCILKKKSTVEQIRKHLFKHNPQATRNTVAHQINRTFRHYHSEHLRPIIKIYFNLFLKKISVEEAKTQLVKCLNDENEAATLQKSDSWDRPIINEFATNEKLQQALHAELMALKDDVVLVEWCSEWLNKYFFFCYDKGPGYYMLTPGTDNKTPVYQSRKGRYLHVTDIFGDSNKFGTHGIWFLSHYLSLPDYADMIKLQWTIELAPEKVHKVSDPLPPLQLEQMEQLQRYKNWIEKKFEQEHQQWQQDHPDVFYDYMEPSKMTVKSDNPFLVRLNFFRTGVMDAYHMPGGFSPCWICGDSGHKKRDCPVKDARCDTCGAKGHLAAACDDNWDEDGGCAFCGSYDHSRNECPEAQDAEDSYWDYVEWLENQRYGDQEGGL